MAENKMEQAATMNNFDKLLGRNGELVEERKKQVLTGALEIVQRYYKETPNKMEVVAKLFGKKLGERFTIARHGHQYEARFFSEGFEVYGLENPYVDTDPFVLMDLLIGEAKIAEDC